MKKALALLVFAMLLTACPTPAQQAHQNAIDRSDARSAYIPKNDVEFKNYNRRQQIADDPTTILWCTSAFPIPSSPLFTFPIVGKITSGSKRPFADDPGPDGMYGPSEAYRYGFTPSGVYVDFYSLSTLCTTEPSIWQRQQTTLVLGTDQKLLDAQRAAQAALKRGDAKTAAALLEAGAK